MRTSRKSSYAMVLMTVVMLSAITRGSQVPLGQLVEIDKTRIKDLIRSYFDARYRSFETLKLQNLDDFTAHTPDSDAFLARETTRLELELKQSEVFHLRYSHYKYYLDYNSIIVFAASGTATAYLVEGRDVVYQVSEELSPDKPIVSKLRNLAHTIWLKKVDGEWKIISDMYPHY